MRNLSFLFLCTLLGCEGASMGIDRPTDEDPLAALERDTGVPWLVRWHADVHTPAFLEGRTAPLAATAHDAERAGREFLLQYHDLFGLVTHSDDVEAVEAETDTLGMTHARFRQKRGDLPVWNGDLVLHFASDGSLVRMNGRLVPIGETPAAASLSPDEARVAAVVAARSLRPDVLDEQVSTQKPSLLLYPIDAAHQRTAYRVAVSLDDLERPARLEIFIDAVDGHTLDQVDLVDSLEGSGLGVFGDRKSLAITQKHSSYWLEDSDRAIRTFTMRGKTTLPGLEVHSKSATSFDTEGQGAGAAVDAHAHLAATWDYFRTVHDRAGWDGKTGPIHASVHYGDGFDNAFFDGTQLVFGDGDGAALSPLSGALDVVAHEYTHGITAHTARLGHADQPGALNEAISDIFAVFVGGSREWRVGESVYHPDGHSQPLRDLAHPHKSDDPAHMDELDPSPADQGSVHRNSTIVSHAAYLMTEGDGDLPRLGPALAQRIWYRALVHYLTPRASFRDAADATLAAAHDLGAGEAAVRGAWIAVGVL